MSEWTWYAVRCCCTPTKIFGFVKLPSDVEDCYRVPLRSYQLSATTRVYDGPPEPVPVQSAVLYVRKIGNERAIYSEDRPIEFWRQVRGFVEATQSGEGT
jgi:hypothetical protein